MRMLCLLLMLLVVMLPGAAAQPGSFEPCRAQNGRCIPGICRRPYYWTGTCLNGYSCCRK
ncbi:OSTR3 protein, partial [Bucco capensis]|nr:OSTR3 protein [Bucco capensis]